MTIRFLRSLRVTRTIIEFLPLQGADGKQSQKVVTPLGLPWQLGLCIEGFWHGFAGDGLTQPLLNLISGRAEFLYRSTHPTGKLRQFFRTEEKHDNEQDYHHVWAHEIEDRSDRNSHKNLRSICFVRKLYGVQSIHTDLARLYSKKFAFYRASSIRRHRFAGLIRKPRE